MIFSRMVNSCAPSILADSMRESGSFLKKFSIRMALPKEYRLGQMYTQKLLISPMER